MSTLAIHGGLPIRRQGSWPSWPAYDDRTEEELLRALRSQRWSVSWRSDGRESRERLFASRFAAYIGVEYCVSVDHGSSALVIALESLNIGPGDEVIVPDLTWVAPVTSVLRVGAVPIVVDVDPRTGCITGDVVARAVSVRTKAVIAVHLACTVADLDELGAVAEVSGIALIEDCSQAHGSEWTGRRVGSFGKLGVFSLGAAKLLAGGEGGAVVTSDPDGYRRLQMLRADSRRYAEKALMPGDSELVEDGAVMGANYCMSELTASILLDQLERLSEQNRRRSTVASELDSALAETGIFQPVPIDPRVTQRSVYEYGIQFDPDVFGDASIESVAAAVTAELGLQVYPPRVPLHRSVLLRPGTKRRFMRTWYEGSGSAVASGEFPGADHYREHTLLFHHSALLGSPDDAIYIVAALNKVSSMWSQLSKNAWVDSPMH